MALGLTNEGDSVDPGQKSHDLAGGARLRAVAAWRETAVEAHRFVGLKAFSRFGAHGRVPLLSAASGQPPGRDYWEAHGFVGWKAFSHFGTHG